MKYITSSAEETVKLGERFAQTLNQKRVFALHGELGSGKTTFTQGIAKGLGITKHTTSPTYIIMRTYTIPSEQTKNFYHVDLYRTGSVHDIEGIGLIDLLKDENNLFVIEWSEKMGELLPKDAIHFYFSYCDDEKHVIEVNQAEGIIDDSWYEKPEGNFPRRISAGGVVVRKEESKLLVALVHEGAMDSVVLPKGGVEENESHEEAARREVAEEAGITKLELVADLGICERYTSHKNAWMEEHFFLFMTDQAKTDPTEKEYVYTTEWFDLEQLPDIFWKEQKELLNANKEKIKQLLSS